MSSTRTVSISLAVVAMTCGTLIAQGATVHPADAIEVLRLNSLALNQFDVLIRRTSVADKSEIGFTHEKLLVRLVFDRVSQRATQVMVGKVSEIGLDEIGNTESKQAELLIGSNVFKESGRLRRLPGPVNTSSYLDFWEATLAHEFWTFDFLSVFEFPMQRVARTNEVQLTDSQQGSGEHMEDLWARAKLQYENSQRSVRGNSLQLSFDLGEGSTDNVELDLDTLLPKRFWAARGSKGKLAFTQKFEWTEIDGVVLPHRISEDRPKRLKLPDKTYLEYERNTTYEFHWISVNKPLDDELLSPTVLDATQQFRTMTDPVSLKAFLDEK